MALPPLELFSLKKRPPCCRVASSLFRVQLSGDCGGINFPKRKLMKKIHFVLHFDLEDRCNAADAESVRRGTRALRRKRHSMSHALHPALQILIALSSLAILIWPAQLVDGDDVEANDFDRTHIR